METKLYTSDGLFANRTESQFAFMRSNVRRGDQKSLRGNTLKLMSDLEDVEKSIIRFDLEDNGSFSQNSLKRQFHDDVVLMSSNEMY